MTNKNRQRRPVRNRKRKKKRVRFRSTLVLGLLLVTMIFFIRNRNLPEEDFEAKNPLTGHGRVEEKVENVEAEATPIDENKVSLPKEQPTFDSNDPEVWQKNLELATANYPHAQLILEHKEELPESLFRLAANNFSAIDFVAKTIDPTIQVEHEYPENLNGSRYPYYMQWDERWGYEPYGNGIIGWTGCGPTSSAMAFSGLMDDESITPEIIAKLSSEHGFSNEQGTSWGLYPFLADYYGANIEQISVDKDILGDHLDQGHAVLVSVGPGDFTVVGHVMLITKMDFLGRLVINDPNSRENSEKRWSFEQVAPQVKAMWAISVPE